MGPEGSIVSVAEEPIPDDTILDDRKPDDKMLEGSV